MINSWLLLHLRIILEGSAAVAQPVNNTNAVRHPHSRVARAAGGLLVRPRDGPRDDRREGLGAPKIHETLYRRTLRVG